MDMEVICISSDDESGSSQKENRTVKLLTKSIETDVVVLAHGKTETLFSDNEKVEQNNLKRKIQTDEDVIIFNRMEKRKRLNLDQSTSKVINKSVPGLNYSKHVTEIQIVKSDCNAQPNKNQEVTIEKTQLIVKEKKKISYVSQDVFPLFISLCLQKCPKYDKTDMDKIVDKLKRRYENLDPIYARSEDFVSFLNEKREAITSNKKKIYVHIEDVMNEMKKKMKKESQALQNNEMYDSVPSTSYATNNVPVNIEVESSNDEDYKDDENNDNEENASQKIRRRIKQVLKAMKECEAAIKRLEEEEVDFNEENNSNYIKSERYKRRMVELYNKLCELTGENADAGRVYLRPKHLNVTRIVAVDQAITNFINSKITQRNKKKRTGALTDDLIFPDYRDILECVNRCNDRKKLGLSENRREQIAKKAFKELGEYLQRTRQNDYWDTFSLYLENLEEDPAVKDRNLARKLADNRTDAEKRLTAVFEEFVRKERELKENNENNEEIASEEEDEDEEESIHDEDKNLSTTSEKDSDNEEDIDKTVEKNKLPIEKNKSNISIVNVRHAMDKAISNETMADTLQEKFHKIVQIKVLKSDTAVLKSENETINEKIIHKPSSSNTILKDVVKDTKTQEDSPAGSTTKCTKVLAEVEAVEASKAITDPATEDVTDTITGVTTELMTGDAAELITENAAKLVTDVTEAITENIAEVITDETEMITENVMDGVIENMPDDEQPEEKKKPVLRLRDGAIENMPNDEQPEEEKKPVLRLRSFAKPPTTWEDSLHKMDKIAQEDTPKVTNQIKEIVDLTNEETAKPPPVITKRAVQFRKVVPLAEHQTLVIPTNRTSKSSANIISVQHITNNFVKVNPQTRQIIAPAVRNIRGSTIILPHPQSTSRQSQLQNVANARENEMIVRIIPNQIIISKKPAVQSVSKETDVSSPTKKSK